MGQKIWFLGLHFLFSQGFGLARPWLFCIEIDYKLASITDLR